MPAPAPDIFRRRTLWWLLLAAATVITLLAAPQASRMSVKTDLSEILARDAPATTTYLDYLHHFGAGERVFIVVSTGETSDRTSESTQVTEAAEKLAARLLASGLVDSTRTGLSADDQEFLLRQVMPRLILNRSPNDPVVGERLTPEAIRRRLSWMRRQLDLPFSPAWQPALFAADPFGLLASVDPETATPLAAPIDLASGSFLAAEGNVALVVATPKAHEIDAGGGGALQAELERLFDQAQSETDVSLEFAAVGGPLYAAHEERSVRRDLIKTLLTSFLAVTLILILYFGRSPAPYILAVSVSAGLVWAAVVPVSLHGGLSVLGVSFGSILLGLGIDYGIHAAVAFQRRAVQGDQPAVAMLKAGRRVLPAIAASVATTTTGFLTLALASFAPLRELGVIVGAGIVLMALAFALVGAPLLVLQRSASGGRPCTGPGVTPVSRLVATLTGAATRRPAIVVAGVLVVTAAAFTGWPRLTVSTDLDSMRSDDRPLEEAEARLAESFGVGMDTVGVTVSGSDLDQTLQRASETTALLRDRLPGARIVSPTDWLLDSRTVVERVQEWSRHQDQLQAAVAALRRDARELGFAPDAFSPGLAIVEQLASGRVPAPIPESTWPDWLASLVRRHDDGVRVAIHVRTDAPSLGISELRQLAREIERETQASVASLDLVAVEMQEAVFDDLKRLGLWCGLAVAMVILISFRGAVTATMMTLLPVVLSGVWLLGFASLLGVEMTPFAIMVLPVVLGIGVDDGLHVVHGWRMRGSLESAAVAAGGAMTLTTVTTLVAFGSLTLSQIPALRQGGVLVAFGTALCLLLTLTLLPAIEALRRTDS